MALCAVLCFVAHATNNRHHRHSFRLRVHIFPHRSFFIFIFIHCVYVHCTIKYNTRHTLRAVSVPCATQRSLRALAINTIVGFFYSFTLAFIQNPQMSNHTQCFIVILFFLFFQPNTFVHHSFSSSFLFSFSFLFAFFILFCNSCMCVCVCVSGPFGTISHILCPTTQMQYITLKSDQIKSNQIEND